MPVKRRATKRRITPEAELEAWSTVFECEFDFFGEVSDMTGLVEPINVWPPEDRAAARPAWLAAAGDAWSRLGERFLETRAPTAVRDVPWALEQFGRPTCQ